MLDSLDYEGSTFDAGQQPFDRLLAVALENFGRAPAEEEQEELGLVAEYLGFFLEGPFNAPRKHIGAASLYTS